MAGITLAKANTFFNSAETAYLSALQGDSYSLSTGGSSRSFKRQPIEKLKSQMEYWASECERLSSTNTGMKVRQGFPL